MTACHNSSAQQAGDTHIMYNTAIKHNMIGAMVCLLAAPWVQLSVIMGSGWPHNALRHHLLMPVSCHF